LEAFVLRTLPTPPKSVDLPRETIAEPVSLFDLRQHHCRWPVAGVGAAMQFCGAEFTHARAKKKDWHRRRCPGVLPEEHQREK
jgi:hypothetical protein